MRLLVLIAGMAYVASGQERVELTASAWRTHSTGTIQSGSVPIDLQSDLGLADRFSFTGRMIVLPGRRHGIVLEGSRLALEGGNDLSRTIVYNGRTYDVRDRIQSAAELDTIYAGYQYSVISGSRGRLAFGGGAAYVRAYGSIRSVTTGIEAAREHQVGLPLLSADARVFLLPDTSLLEVAGDIKGMSFGRYGRYVLGGIHAGINFGPVGVRVGYIILDADVHEGSEASNVGIAPRLAGPAFSLVFRH